MIKQYLKNKVRPSLAYAILFALLLCCILPYNSVVSASGTKKYLSLGDSVASGYGLKNTANDSYPNLLTKDLSRRGTNYELVDFSSDTLDSSGLLRQLSDMSNKELMSALQSASVITVSIGLNNFINPFNDLSSSMSANAKNPDGSYKIPDNIDPNNITVDSITSYLSEMFKPGVKEYDEMIKMLDKSCEQFKSDFAKISGLLSKYTNAQVVFLTLYNPYKDFAVIKPLYDMAELYIGKINNIIKEQIKSNVSYIFADNYKAFNKSNKRLVNASFLTFNMDPQPNAAGHKLIYRTIANSLGYSVYFDDMSSESWASGYVDDLHELNIIFGTDSQKREFSPQAELKNQDLAVLLVRTLKLKIADSDVSDVTLPFSDANKIESYALNSVKACYKAGLYSQLYPVQSGKTYIFGPQSSAKRIDVALMVVQLIDKSKWSAKKPIYSDLNGVDAAYFPALSTLYDYGIMVGYPDKTLTPFAGLTRAQVAKILWVILDNPEL